MIGASLPCPEIGTHDKELADLPTRMAPTSFFPDEARSLPPEERRETLLFLEPWHTGRPCFFSTDPAGGKATRLAFGGGG